MKITGSEMQMASSHASFQHHEIKESLRMWVGNQRPDFEANGNPAPPRAVAAIPADPVKISTAGKAAQSAEAEAIESSIEQAEKDPRLMLLRAIIYMLTGKEARVFDASDMESPPPTPDLPTKAPSSAAEGGVPSERPAGYGVEYDYHESHTEVEQTSFAASGVVHTADGKEISFALNLSMSRMYHEESNVSLRLGDAARQKKDPLVVNFSGTAAQLSDQRFSFDIDTDGTADSINQLVSGSGFLALDRNSDGKINDGSELFGAQSGDGFADLAAFDSDRNGWIDENDAAYAKLQVWTPDAAGNGSLQSLQDADVGAISLMRVSTPFDLRNGDNETLGTIRSSGIFLQESGGTGTIQQIDLSV
jgi:hypothetical protein